MRVCACVERYCYIAAVSPPHLPRPRPIRQLKDSFFGSCVFEESARQVFSYASERIRWIAAKARLDAATANLAKKSRSANS